MKTREDVEKLKKKWMEDPCYDIYDFEGYEQYKFELVHFQNECEMRWKNELLTQELNELKGLKVALKTIKKYLLYFDE